MPSTTSGGPGGGGVSRQFVEILKSSVAAYTSIEDAIAFGSIPVGLVPPILWAVITGVPLFNLIVIPVFSFSLRHRHYQRDYCGDYWATDLVRPVGAGDYEGRSGFGNHGFVAG
jgi:hypothetical protein